MLTLGITLEEENERLRKELEVWTKKALQLSKQVYVLERNREKNVTESAEKKSGRTAQQNQHAHEKEAMDGGHASAAYE